MGWKNCKASRNLAKMQRPKKRHTRQQRRAKERRQRGNMYWADTASGNHWGCAALIVILANTLFWTWRFLT